MEDLIKYEKGKLRITSILLVGSRAATAKNIDNIRALNDLAENSLNATLDTIDRKSVV